MDELIYNKDMTYKQRRHTMSLDKEKTNMTFHDESKRKMKAMRAGLKQKVKVFAVLTAMVGSSLGLQSCATPTRTWNANTSSVRMSYVTADGRRVTETHRSSGGNRWELRDVTRGVNDVSRSLNNFARAAKTFRSAF